MDGTFKSAPHLFYQIYIIHGNVHGGWFPLVLAVMESKSKTSYFVSFRTPQGKGDGFASQNSESGVRVDGLRTHSHGPSQNVEIYVYSIYGEEKVWHVHGEDKRTKIYMNHPNQNHFEVVHTVK